LVAADRRQPGRCAAAAPGRVQDQVGIDGLLDANGAVRDPHPGDAVPGCGGDEPDDLAPVDELDGGQRPHPGQDVTFQEGPAGLVGDEVWGMTLEAEPMADRGKA
jgi:hypothetical protein